MVGLMNNTCNICSEEITAINRIKCGKRSDGSQKYRPNKCKDCHSKRVIFDEQMRRMIKNPVDWWQCEDCCKPIHKRIKKDTCPDCGSGNIEKA
jgi:DNA-directed RNA polymerase subunit RPC12/RpoP